MLTYSGYQKAKVFQTMVSSVFRCLSVKTGMALRNSLSIMIVTEPATIPKVLANIQAWVSK